MEIISKNKTDHQHILDKLEWYLISISDYIISNKGTLFH